MEELAQYLPLLGRAPLFAGFSPAELDALVGSLSPAVRSRDKGETLLLAGQESLDIGVVLAGRLLATKHTRAGEQFLVQRLAPGDVYADVLSGAHQKSPVTVSAATPCKVMLVPAARLFAPPGPQDALYRRLLANLVAVISDKYFTLDRRIDLLLVRGLRRRIAAWLLDEWGVRFAPALAKQVEPGPRANGPSTETVRARCDAAGTASQCEAGAAASGGSGKRGGAGTFTVPYNRAQLAAYLGCERSALSRELSRMAAAGLITVSRSRFSIPDVDALRGVL